MGLIEAIFGRKQPAGSDDIRYQTLTAYQPAFRSWGGALYESELIRTAVDAIARHASKLCYKMEGSARPKLYTATKPAPNPWMTWSQYMERCANIYSVENNLFIVPLLDDTGEVTGFFPAVPSECELVGKGTDPFLKFTFIGGEKRSIRLHRVGLVVKHQLKDDFFGSSNSPLRPTMELNNMISQGIAEGVKNGATFRFMAQLTSKTFDEDLKKERKRFNETNLQDGSGGLLFRWDAARGTVTVDRTGLDKRFNQQVGEVLSFSPDTPLRDLRVFIDSNSAEFFLNGGEATFTTHVYPTEDEHHLSVTPGVQHHLWRLGTSVTDAFVC